jgi:threonine dehydrogenase-like Zn-dependent dehydrogenase
VITRVMPSPVFTRKGDDLVVEVPVTFAEAALGAKIEVPTLDGRVKITVPAGSQDGRTLRVPGKGAPKLNGSGAGSLLAKLRVSVPASLTDEQREALEAERIGGRRAARIAIVGAGPAGLWLAVLLARKHATLTLTGNAVKITRNSHAPQIDVYERRLPAAEAGANVRSADEANKYDHSSDNSEATRKALHGSRNIILAITQQTQDLLNRHLCGTASSHSHHAFAPTSRIGDIERIRAAEFERYCAAGFGQLTYGAVVGDPDEFHSARRGGYDVVFVASGKKGVPDEWRIARGLESIVEGTAAAILVQVR